MTDPKARRFTADEMEALANEGERNPAVQPFAFIFRQAAQTERERERIMAIVGEKCQRLRNQFTGEINYHKAFGKFQVLIKNCPACAIRRAAGLDKEGE